MKELIPVRRDIIGKDLINGCEGRRFHEFLEVRTDYTHWFDRRIKEYGFIENQDFLSLLTESTGGRPEINHFISIDMAKELSMVEKTAKGKEARLYFISCEKALSKLTKQLSELDTHIKASRFFQNKITEGKKAGLSKQDAVLRAYTAAFEQTGYEFSDALPDDFKSSKFTPGTITAEKAIGRFISECCETGKDFNIKAGELYKAYLAWAAEKKYKPVTQTKFGREIKKRFDSFKVSCILYTGIRLKER